MTCQICEQIEKNDVLFANEQFAILLPQKGYLPGHVLLVPRQHYVILEQVPQTDLSSLLIHANTISSLLFEKLNAHGTNIMVRNGVPAGQTLSHIAIDIIPRWKDDGVDLQWQPQQISDDVFKKTFTELKDEIDVAQAKTHETKTVAFDTAPPVVVEKHTIEQRTPELDERPEPPSERTQPSPHEKPATEEKRKAEQKKPATDYAPLKDARVQHLRRMP